MSGTTPNARRFLVLSPSIVLLAALLAGSPAAVRESAVRGWAGAFPVDVNRDGQPDVVAVCQSGVIVYPSGSDAGRLELGHATPIVGVAALDVDDDGDPDIVTLSEAGRLRVWENDGAGHLSAHVLAARQTPRGPHGMLQQPTAAAAPQQSDDPFRTRVPRALTAQVRRKVTITRGPAVTRASEAPLFSQGRPSRPCRAPPLSLA